MHLFVQLAVAASIGLCGHAYAQKLPPTSRTVYKCEANGKVTYSDEPCPAAKRIEVEPTRGLTSTGKEPVGADVRNERLHEQIGEAARPLTGMDSKQFEVARKRAYLAPEAKAECRALDSSIQRLEEREQQSKNTDNADASAVRADLLRQRKRFRELRC